MLKHSRCKLQQPLFRCLTIAFLALALSACGSDTSDRETLLREAIDAIQTAAEARKLSEMMSHVSDNYADTNGRNRKEVRAVAQLQFLRYPKIHTFKVIKMLTLEDDDHASVSLLVATAGRPIDSAAALGNLRADMIRFDLQFTYQHRWLLTSAIWQPATATDFLH